MFTLEEIETIKEALTIALESEDLEDPEAVIRILDKIDEEFEID